jgi:DNA-binding NtrC family response regulator
MAEEPLGPDVESFLRDRGWDLLYARGDVDARSKNRASPFFVGLIVLPERHGPKWLDRCRQLVSSTAPIQWVALVDRIQVQQDAVKRFIVDGVRVVELFPLETARLADTLERAYCMAAIEDSLRDEQAPTTLFGEYGMVGKSRAMRELYSTIDRAAGADISILVTGASGTGKELVARALHQHSSRASGPFVALNCAAIPHALLQSELFGYEKGAFTDAFEQKMGHIEAAAGGTLLLDEIGEMPLESQASLLRFLEDRTVTRVGGTSADRVDVRIIATTKKELEQDIRQGTFRADLFYRLAILTIRTPSLSEREGDIRLLANHFLSEAREPTGHKAIGFDERVLSVLEGQEWRGNVRELRSVIFRAAAMCTGRYITLEDLNLDGPSPENSTILQDALQETENRVVRRALLRNRWNVTRAAKDLHVSRMTLYRLMEKHGISRGDQHFS